MAALQATGRIVKHQAKGPVTYHAPETWCAERTEVINMQGYALGLSLISSKV